ncbi:GNAT family N-acetyltransferase [Thiothrix subterranea]|uniref:GNAT family N-acetyltransferase n=1 Tax=Thiothrix subterranea TaxID=2735563 RepID=A0AA51MK18_9GAMM|nr:GNAT family N-acetyltransferase [Thiothrix subterranea]MDQ5770697.1 GNAT family N-acetyltransferase [Thiothrix subterranea]WML85939.1 GNAT family N-acetyltransferase [Thiothrix subterranea]
MITQLVTAIRELRDIVPAWDLLTRQALEPNVFYESWALLPALDALVSPELPVAVLLVWADTAHSHLTGLLPLVRSQTYQKFPACHWMNWLHPHCPLGTPLVHQDYAEETLQAVFAWLREHSGAMAFSLNKVPAEGEFARQLRLLTHQQGGWVNEHDTWERAVLTSGLSGEAYVSTHQRKKKLKEYNRLRRRLEALGTLECRALLPGQSHGLSDWIKDFLDLEQQGWKGRALTAMSCQSGERQFAENLIRNAAAQGQLMMLKLLLDGEVIAIKLNLTSATQGGYALKIAYNEAYAAYSPGVLLELENIYCTLDNTPLPWVDSCAIPNHPMINHLWVERRKMANFHMSTHRVLSKPLLHSMQLVKIAYQYCKGIKA